MQLGIKFELSERFHTIKSCTQILHIDKQKLLGLKMDFCVSCASAITTLMTIHNRPFLSQRFSKTLVM